MSSHNHFNWLKPDCRVKADICTPVLSQDRKWLFCPPPPTLLLLTCNAFAPRHYLLVHPLHGTSCVIPPSKFEPSNIRIMPEPVLYQHSTENPPPQNLKKNIELSYVTINVL